MIRKFEIKLTVLLLAASTAASAEWDAIYRVPVDQKIEVTTRDGKRTRAAFVSAAGDSLVMREQSGELSLQRGAILRVRIFDPARRIRRGVLWTAVGAGAGAGAGAAACPSCPNEGHGYKYAGPGAAVGAGLGALGFLSSPYRTVYKGK